MKNFILRPGILLFSLWACITRVEAHNTIEVEIIIKNHRFIPNIIEVPSGKKIWLIVHNHDKTAEEFESFDLKREKLIPGEGKTKIILAPLKPGEYKFFGEFFPETAQGKLVVKKLPDLKPE